MGKGYLKTDDLIFSEWYGGNLYSLSEQSVSSPLPCSEEYGCSSPLLCNINTGEEYFLKRFDPVMIPAFRMKQYLLHPPCRKHILWPCDMILFPNREKAGVCTLFVSREYSEDLTPPAQRTENCALLFRAGGFPPLVNAGERLSRIADRSWKNPEIRRIARNFLEAVQSINETGYLYGDIHLSRIYFSDEDEVFFDFSNLIYSFSDAETFPETCRADTGWYPLEFGDPYIASGVSHVLDYRAQNFSICSFLFYLFLGEFPYNGLALEEKADDNLQHHYDKFRTYHKIAVFVFDPEDHSNRLSFFEENQQAEQSWEDLPEDLKEIFICVLRKENAMRTDPCEIPTPKEWLSLMKQKKWLEEPAAQPQALTEDIE